MVSNRVFFVVFEVSDDDDDDLVVVGVADSPLLDALSDFDNGNGRFSDDGFLLGVVSLLTGDANFVPFNGGVLELWPICDTVLHKFPNGAYLDRALSLNGE